MTKRAYAWGAIVIALTISLCGIGWTFFGSSEVVLAQETLQQKIDRKLPYVTHSGVSVSKVQLDLSDGKIGLAIEASATKLRNQFTISAQTRGTLRYDDAGGSFYFRPDSLNITCVRLNGERLSQKASTFIERYVDSPKINAHKEEVVAAGAELVHELVQSAAETALARVPVYTLPDTLKGNVVRMFVRSVEVSDGKIIAHLSFWQFTKMLALYVILLVLAIVASAVLVRFPKWDWR